MILSGFLEFHAPHIYKYIGTCTRVVAFYDAGSACGVRFELECGFKYMSIALLVVTGTDIPVMM